MDFKSYPFYPKYLTNFFERSTNLYYPSKIETKVVINICELPENEKLVFLDFFLKNQKKILMKVFSLIMKSNKKLFFVIILSFQSCVFKYFLKNPSYLEILDFIPMDYP